MCQNMVCQKSVHYYKNGVPEINDMSKCWQLDYSPCTCMRCAAQERQEGKYLQTGQKGTCRGAAVATTDLSGKFDYEMRRPFVIGISA